MRPTVTALAALGLAIASPALGADAPEQAPLAPRTAQTGLPLTPAQQAMDLAHLALSITVDPATKSLTAEARYRIRAIAPLAEAQFDLDPRFAISAVSVDGTAIARERWRNDGGLLTIELPAVLAKGRETSVVIAYSGKPFVAKKAPWDGGFVWSTSADGKPWIATAVQGEGCDLFWPCIDNPTKRVALLDTAVRVPEPLVQAGNGKLVGVEHEGGWATWRWRAKYPQGYGVTLQIGPYELTERSYASRYGTTIPLKFWHLCGHEEGAERLLGEARESRRMIGGNCRERNYTCKTENFIMTDNAARRW